MRKKLTFVTALAFVAALSAGFEAANVTANAAETKDGFAITATSVRYDDPAKEGVDSGLRFKIDVPAGATVTNAYTTITVTPVGKETVSTNVEATVWRNDGSGWNTVLLDIPASDYATEVTAQAFATIDGVAYETAAVTSSIAKTASIVMNEQNAIDETLNVYVNNVESITLNETETVSLIEGDAVQLTATTQPKGYSVVWSSSDENVATVDNTGKVVMQAASGSATITASMGGVEKSIAVTSTGMATKLHFDNGVNNYVTAVGSDDSVECVGPRTQAEESIAAATATGTLKGDPGDWTLVLGFDADYLANVFADASVTDLEFKMYTELDGIANIQSNNSAVGAPFKVSSTTNTSIEIWLGYTMTDMGDYLLMRLPRTLYTNWLSKHTDGTTAETAMSVQMRLGRLDTNEDSATYGKKVWGAYSHLYIDDVQGTSPLTASGDFEDGNALFVNPVSGVDQITINGIIDRADGNHALEVKGAYSNYFGFNKAFIDAMFVDENVTAMQFKVYTDWKISGHSTQYFIGFNRNNSWFQYKNASQITIEEQDGYLLVTIYRTGWKTLHDGVAKYVADGTLTSDPNMYVVMMRLSATAGGTTAAPGTYYIDDFVAVKA